MKKIVLYSLIIQLFSFSLHAFSAEIKPSSFPVKEAIDIIVKTPDGKPVVNASVELFSIDGQLLWEAKSDVKGKATVWCTDINKIGWVTAKWQNVETRLKYPIPASIKGTNTLILDIPCQQFNGKDIVVLLDATHSMKAEFATILSAVRSQNIPVMLARDVGERFLIHKIDDQTNIPSFAIQAAGGGSDEEAIDTILLTALQQYDWKEQATSRQLIYITDALPRLYDEEGKMMERAIRYATSHGISISTIACEGINIAGENSLYEMALLTGGSCTYLQDSTIVSTTGRISLSEWLSINQNTDTVFSSCADDEHHATAVTNTNSPLLLNCYPNPATTTTSIQLTEAIVQLNIYSSDGRLHYQSQQQIEDSRLEIEVAEWPSGVYWVEVLNASGTSFKGQLSVVK